MNDISTYQFSLSFSVSSEMKDADITSVLQITPTRTACKGDAVSSALELEFQQNFWEICRSYPCVTDSGGAIASFFNENPAIADNMSWLKSIGTPSLRLSFSTEYAMFGFTLSAEDVCVLNKLGIPIEFSVFSWGMVRDEENCQ